MSLLDEMRSRAGHAVCGVPFNLLQFGPGGENPVCSRDPGHHGDHIFLADDYSVRWQADPTQRLVDFEAFP